MQWSYTLEMQCTSCGEEHELKVAGPLALEERKRAEKFDNKFDKEYVAYTAIGAPKITCRCDSEGKA